LTRNIESGKKILAHPPLAHLTILRNSLFTFLFSNHPQALVFVLGPPPDGGAANLSMPFLIRIEE
jgi:hypothetical protein